MTRAKAEPSAVELVRGANKRLEMVESGLKYVGDHPAIERHVGLARSALKKALEQFERDSDDFR